MRHKRWEHWALARLPLEHRLILAAFVVTSFLLVEAFTTLSSS